MNTSRILMTILAVSFLGTQPIVAADQPKSGVLKREYQAFKEAIRCARKEGFSKCSRAQKNRVIIAGTALAAAIAATAGYIGISKLISFRDRFTSLILKPNSSNDDLEQLLQRGYVFPNATYKDIPLLQWAISAQRYKIAKQLVQRGAKMEGITTMQALEAGIIREEESGGVYPQLYARTDKAGRLYPRGQITKQLYKFPKKPLQK